MLARWFPFLWLLLWAWACGESGDAHETVDAAPSAEPSSRAFVLTVFGFLYPEDSGTDGFDLDARTSRRTDSGECPHDDRAGGVDDQFLELIERLLSLDEGSLKPLGPGECPVRFDPGEA